MTRDRFLELLIGGVTVAALAVFATRTPGRAGPSGSAGVSVATYCGRSSGSAGRVACLEPGEVRPRGSRRQARRSGGPWLRRRPADGKIPYRPGVLEKRKRNWHANDGPAQELGPAGQVLHARHSAADLPRVALSNHPDKPRTSHFTYEWSHKKRIAPIGDTSRTAAVPDGVEPAGTAWPAVDTTATRSSSR